MTDEFRELERESRAAFDQSVDAIDASTRARLARARARALEQLARRRMPEPALWIPAGAAAAALVAALLWRNDDSGMPPQGEVAVAAIEDLDLIVRGEDFGILQEDEGFYAWAEEQMSGGVG